MIAQLQRTRSRVSKAQIEARLAMAGRDNAIAQSYRETAPVMKSPVAFKTHPNAPVVVNYAIVHAGRLYHNGDAYGAKYCDSMESAVWLRDRFNKEAMGAKFFYIVE